MPEWAVAFDVETHKSQPGLAAPPLVLGATAALDSDGKTQTKLWSKEDTLAVLLELLEDDRYVIVGAHIPYDFLVCTLEWRKRGRDIFPLIFRAYEQGRVWDILVAEALNGIANGCRGKDPRTGKKLRDPTTGDYTSYYSLAIVSDLRLGRVDAKANDEFRTRYAVLDGLPLDQLPQSARDYPQDDVRNTLDNALAQIGYRPSIGRHGWGPDGHCVFCNAPAEQSEAACWALRPARNRHQVSVQVETAWALHVGAAWGFDVDQAAVDKEVTRVEDVRKAAAPKLIEFGFLKWKKEKGEMVLSESRGKIARAVAAAQGATEPCKVCGGVGRVPKDKVPTRVKYDPEKHGRGCIACCSTGFDLSTVPDLKRTDPSDTFPDGQVKADADTLAESVDDKLRILGDYKEDAKVITNYGPYLRRAKRVEPDGSWRSVPLTLWPNVLLDSDRTSYADAIQQFPRDGALRACIRARKGYVLCSCDYNQGEVITHAQSLLWILGWSRQAEMVLAGKELHSMFGSTVLRVDYDEFFKNKKKNKAYANARQAAKPWIFGKPGRMGAVKLVQQQRSQGPDTPCPNGPVEIEIESDGGKKIKVRGYRGLRFCILMDGATRCGETADGRPNKATSWGKKGYERRISPTCRACLECAERLQAVYYETFPEARKYFDYCEAVVDEGQPLTDEQCAALYLPPGSSLEPATMCQHVSWIIRGGLEGNDACNGYFQSLLAVASKLAMRWAQRECCDPTYRVPTDACAGGKVSRFAGRVSPLLGSRCIVLQHDEIIAELLEAKASDAAARLSEIMVRAFQVTCPDMAPSCKAPPALMFRWFKSAEPVYVCQSCGHVSDKETCPKCLAAYGKLVAWEPPPEQKDDPGALVAA